MTPDTTLLAKVAALFDNHAVRYSAVAASNTVVGFSLYIGALSLVGAHNYWIALIASHLLGTTFAFVLYRKFVFTVAGPGLLDYARFQLVYLAAFAANAVFLIFMVEKLGAAPEVAQAICLVVIAATSYLGHRFFSFRRPSAQKSSNHE